MKAQVEDRQKEKEDLLKRIAQLNAEIDDLGFYYKAIRQEQKHLREVVFTLADGKEKAGAVAQGDLLADIRTEQDDWEVERAKLPAPERTKRNVFDEYGRAQREDAKKIPRTSQGDSSAIKVSEKTSESRGEKWSFSC